jgi:hypothetical protein
MSLQSSKCKNEQRAISQTVGMRGLRFIHCTSTLSDLCTYKIWSWYLLYILSYEEEICNRPLNLPTYYIYYLFCVWVWNVFSRLVTWRFRVRPKGETYFGALKCLAIPTFISLSLKWLIVNIILKMSFTVNQGLH